MSRRRTRVACWSADTTASTCHPGAFPHTDDSAACASTLVPRRGLNAASGILSAAHNRPSGRAPSHRRTRTPALAHRYPGKCAAVDDSCYTSVHSAHRNRLSVHSVRTWAAAAADQRGGIDQGACTSHAVRSTRAPIRHRIDTLARTAAGTRRHDDCTRARTACHTS